MSAAFGQDDDPDALAARRALATWPGLGIWCLAWLAIVGLDGRVDLANQAMVLVVKDRQKFAHAGAVLAAAKARPEAVNYASSGDGSPQHLAALMFETRMKVRMVHIPYKGGALAIMSEQRSALVPDVPTMREAGMDNMVFQTWIGLPFGRPEFVDPAFLGLVAWLGLACTLARLRSGSIWPGVVIHWGVVVMWISLYGG